MSTYTTAVRAMVELIGEINPDVPYGLIRLDCTRALDDALTAIRAKYRANDDNRTTEVANG